MPPLRGSRPPARYPDLPDNAVRVCTQRVPGGHRERARERLAQDEGRLIHDEMKWSPAGPPPTPDEEGRRSTVLATSSAGGTGVSRT